MRRGLVHSVAGPLLLAGLTMPVAAQSLARRVHVATPGLVRFSFAAQPDVCGDGDNIVRIREAEDHRIEYIRGRGRLRGVSRIENHAWIGQCDFGPVVVTLDRRADRFEDVRLRVGGDDIDADRAMDLGRVGAQEAVDYLLGEVVRRSDDLAAREALLAATLADSAETWTALLEIGRDERISSSIRRNAVFWVGQAAAAKATEGLASIARDDAEDLDLRKHAVFALSQRPRAEGVPALIDVARSSHEPELIKSALFWLGQSSDPRALDLFREILSRR